MLYLKKILFFGFCTLNQIKYLNDGGKLFQFSTIFFAKFLSLPFIIQKEIY